MSLDMNDIRVGMIIELDGALYKVLTRHHKKKNRGKPTTVCKLKNLNTDATLEKTFHATDTAKEPDIERGRIKFIYGNRGTFVFSEPDNPGNRFELSESVIGEAQNFLKSNETVEALRHNGKIISITLPVKIDFKVSEAPPNVKGNTQGSTTKDIVLETGAIIKTPMFINKGDIVKVNTETGEYVERVEKGK